jgi:hypothetical protein
MQSIILLNWHFRAWQAVIVRRITVERECCIKRHCRFEMASRLKAGSKVPSIVWMAPLPVAHVNHAMKQSLLTGLGQWVTLIISVSYGMAGAKG